MWGDGRDSWQSESPVKMKKFAFLLYPSFQMLGLISAIEVLRVANSVLEKPIYSWIFVHDGEPEVASSSGLRVTAEQHISDLKDFDVLIVTASFGHQNHVSALTSALLRRFARFGKTLGSFESGIFLLAQAGVMDGHKARHISTTCRCLNRFSPKSNLSAASSPSSTGG